MSTVGVAARHHRTEPQLIFRRGEERTDHAVIVVRLAVLDYVQPEVVAALVYVAMQVAEVLNQHKGRIVLTDLLDFAFSGTCPARLSLVAQLSDAPSWPTGKRPASSRQCPAPRSIL